MRYPGAPGAEGTTRTITGYKRGVAMANRTNSCASSAAFEPYVLLILSVGAFLTAARCRACASRVRVHSERPFCSVLALSGSTESKARCFLQKWLRMLPSNSTDQGMLSHTTTSRIFTTASMSRPTEIPTAPLPQGRISRKARNTLLASGSMGVIFYNNTILSETTGNPQTSFDTANVRIVTVFGLMLARTESVVLNWSPI